MRLVAQASRGRSVETIRGVRVFPDFRSMTIEAEPSAWMEADGELIGKVSRLEVTPEEARLRVVD
jgi:hypothetical protein